MEIQTQKEFPDNALAWYSRRQVEDIPAIGGAYLLSLHLDQTAIFDLNRRGSCELPQGQYYYAGSAQGPGGLRSRIRRHFKQQKNIHWHVDHLTVIAAELGAYVSLTETECELAAMLVNTGLFEHVLDGFGSSDCKTCASHLLRDIR